MLELRLETSGPSRSQLRCQQHCRSTSQQHSAITLPSCCPAVSLSHWLAASLSHFLPALLSRQPSNTARSIMCTCVPHSFTQLLPGPSSEL